MDLPDACDFVVFGGTGDLALRKLLPALYQCDIEDRLPADTRVIAVSRSELDDDAYRAQVRLALAEHVAPEHHDLGAVERLLARLHHVSVDVEDDHDWHSLFGTLKDRPGAEHGADDTVRVFYLAVAPSLFGPICRHLGDGGLAEAPARVVLEKPIGHDLASARAVNDVVGSVFDESQIFRIDHYLGKESVQNLLVTRFANTFLEPLWNSHSIDHVQITVSETLGAGARAGYYDRSGALRDMVQNHLLQLLCLVAMEPPIEIGGGREDVRDEKLKVLQALRPMRPEDVDRDTVRGRYAAGWVAGEPVPGYVEELGEAGHASLTETYVALRAEIQNWRWAGVPFYLRTGKRLDRRASEIVVVFKDAPYDPFRQREGATEPNRLTIQVQPEEGMRIHLNAKEPGPGGYRLKPVSLDLSYASAFDKRSPDAYERLLMDVVRGNMTLFMRRDEVEAAWAWCEPILRHWESSAVPPKTYPAGSAGPTASFTLIERDGRSWQES
ncbi:glucose-6-phosphate dehydrogenase [Nocardioides sp. BP30]|uniref:glucose-6-phosphate dehydrogenase n=1 Tax=Nocardioides sp. BP30 TaxID=3036374 RepID=UPI00246968B1|nr:glucose-6-phosphate dehydrogenase [Nocardioides sp. BP30]WGL53054.1 glucose-6-phosphate dehydrogenase [Nocardioides sp. BP30]